MASGELGFRPVPWRWRSGDGLLNLPVDSAEPGGEKACEQLEPGHRERLLCSRPAGHSGTHRAGDGLNILGEWW